jgi:superfamily II RNA helicase
MIDTPAIVKRSRANALKLSFAIIELFPSQREVVNVSQESKSVLVFCGTRNRVESTAAELADMCARGLFTVHERATVISSGNSPSKRAEFLAQLPKNTPLKLRECFERGIGYHHASMLHFLLIHRLPHLDNYDKLPLLWFASNSPFRFAGHVA